MIVDDDKIAQILDIDPIDPSSFEEANKQLPANIPPKKSSDEKDIDSDAEYVRGNLYDIISKGSGAMDELLLIADRSQNPRAYEVIATMMKTLLDANKDLMAAHEIKQKLKEKKNDTLPAPNVTNNNLFVGSTSDIAKKLLDHANTVQPRQ